MAHGTPDYGVTAGTLTRHQLLDVGELAARLGSPVTHDRRGDVVWWDDAECGATKWGSILVGANASFGTSTARARNGRSSFRLRPGDAIGNTATMQHVNPVVVPSRMALEFAFMFGGEVMRLRWIETHQDGTNFTLFGIEYDQAAQELRYLDATNVYVAFATGVVLAADTTLFHVGKMVINPAITRYERFIMDHRTYDLDAFSARSIGGGVQASRIIQIREETLGAVPNGVFIDDVILTENEPANP